MDIKVREKKRMPQKPVNGTQSDCTKAHFFNHSTVTEGDNAISTVHGRLPYISRLSSNWLTDRLNFKDNEATHQLFLNMLYSK